MRYLHRMVMETHESKATQMKHNMATRNPQSKVPMSDCTQFVLHIGQTLGNTERKHLIDYTEYKLIKYASAAKDPQQKLVLFALVKDYRDGKVAIAWKHGTPVYFKVTKDGTPNSPPKDAPTND